MRLDRTAGVCLALVLVSATMAGVPAGVVAHDRNLSEDEVARLAAVARLWTTVRVPTTSVPVTVTATPGRAACCSSRT